MLVATRHETILSRLHSNSVNKIAFVTAFATRSLASVSEWGKVLRATSPSTTSFPLRSHVSPTTFTLIRTSLSSHPRSLLHRMHGAGTRNAVFDGTFFTLSRHFEVNKGWSKGACYAISASIAVVIDYAIDVVVKRAMSVPPGGRVQGVFKEVRNAVRRDGLQVYRGVGAKSMEFAVSYAATGLVASVLLMLRPNMI